MLGNRVKGAIFEGSETAMSKFQQWFLCKILWCLFNVRVFWNAAAFRFYMILSKNKNHFRFRGKRVLCFQKVFWCEIFMKRYFSWKVTMSVINRYWCYFLMKYIQISCLYEKLTQNKLLIKFSKLVVFICGRRKTCKKIIHLKTTPCDVFQMWYKNGK